MSTRTLSIGVSIVIVVILILALVSNKTRKQTIPTLATKTTSESVAVESAPPLTKSYKNPEYHFSVEMPSDFNSQSLPTTENGARIIVLQDAKGNGIQILISKYQSNIKTITTDDVRASIPDMKVTDDQVVEIGNDYKGVAFKSDNEAFGGASREVWFVFKGNLYQISTYARLDPLLKAMFATWKFY